MNKEKYSVYATNKAGMIKSPKGPLKDEPRASKIKSDVDLRAKKRG